MELLYAQPAANAVPVIAMARNPTRLEDHDDAESLVGDEFDVLCNRRLTAPVP